MAVYTTAQQYFINLLRSQLSMRITPAAGSAYTLYSKLGDDELWEDLRFGLNYFNTIPPIQSTLRFSDLYSANAQVASGSTSDNPDNENFSSIYETPVIMCAMLFVGIRLGMFEAGKHFRYNDNGISLERAKGQEYQNVLSSYILPYLTTALPLIRTTLAYSQLNIRGQFSGLIGFPRSISRSLRGTRLGSG